MKDGRRFDLYLFGILALGIVVGITIGFLITNFTASIVIAIILFIVGLALTIPFHKHLKNIICPEEQNK